MAQFPTSPPAWECVSVKKATKKKSWIEKLILPCFNIVVSLCFPMISIGMTFVQFVIDVFSDSDDHSTVSSPRSKWRSHRGFPARRNPDLLRPDGERFDTREAPGYSPPHITSAFTCNSFSSDGIYDDGHIRRRPRQRFDDSVVEYVSPPSFLHSSSPRNSRGLNSFHHDIRYSNGDVINPVTMKPRQHVSAYGQSKGPFGLYSEFSATSEQPIRQGLFGCGTHTDIHGGIRSGGFGYPPKGLGIADGYQPERYDSFGPLSSHSSLGILGGKPAGVPYHQLNVGTIPPFSDTFTPPQPKEADAPPMAFPGIKDR